MDKKTTIAFILIGILFVVWLNLNSPEQPPAPKKQTNKTEKVDTVNKTATTPQPAVDTSKKVAQQNFKEDIITIENDVAVIELSTKGGAVRKVFMKNFNHWYYKDKVDSNSLKAKVQLVNYKKGETFGLIFVSNEGKQINTANMPFTFDASKKNIKLSGDQKETITLKTEVSPGKFIEYDYTFTGNKYSFDNAIEFHGLNNVISNNTYDVSWEGGINFVEENSVDESGLASASAFHGGEQVILDASDIDKRASESYSGRVDWLAFRNKYFAIIYGPTNPDQIEKASLSGQRYHAPNEGVNEVYEGRFTIPFENKSYEKKVFNFYAGPIDYDILKGYEKKYEAIFDFGSFFGLKFIVRPIAEYILLPLFKFLHMFIPNYGFVIILFALIIKIVLHPLSKKSMYSMKKMQMLQPKINEIKEKQPDPTKQQQEIMKLYSTYGINPAGGCLPLLLQMPIFVALWGTFQSVVELRQQPFFWWINDLSRPDVMFSLPFKFLWIQDVAGLALLMGITTFIQQKQTIKDPTQKAMVYIMPVMLTLMFMSFPSGLNLYYFMFNLFSIAQQYYINHTHKDMVLEPVKEDKRKKGFMQKMMEAAEKNQKLAQQAKKKK